MQLSPTLNNVKLCMSLCFLGLQEVIYCLLFAAKAANLLAGSLFCLDLLLILKTENEVFVHLIQYKQALFHYCLNRTEVSKSRDLKHRNKSHKRETHHKNLLIKLRWSI